MCPTSQTAVHGNRHLLLDALAQALAVNSRRLQDKGIFAPAAPTPPGAEDTGPAQAERRAIVQMLYVHFLAPGLLSDVRCVAFTRARRRCTEPVLDPRAPNGTWTLVPAGSRPAAGEGQLPLPVVWMAVYDLSGLPYAEQLRWYAQRCPAHATVRAAADAVMKEWEVFDPQAHHQHIHCELPQDQPPSNRAEFP